MQLGRLIAQSGLPMYHLLFELPGVPTTNFLFELPGVPATMKRKVAQVSHLYNLIAFNAMAELHCKSALDWT